VYTEFLNFHISCQRSIIQLLFYSFLVAHCAPMQPTPELHMLNNQEADQVETAIFVTRSSYPVANDREASGLQTSCRSRNHSNTTLGLEATSDSDNSRFCYQDKLQPPVPFPMAAKRLWEKPLGAFLKLSLFQLLFTFPDTVLAKEQYAREGSGFNLCPALPDSPFHSSMPLPNYDLKAPTAIAKDLFSGNPIVDTPSFHFCEPIPDQILHVEEPFSYTIPTRHILCYEGPGEHRALYYQQLKLANTTYFGTEWPSWLSLHLEKKNQKQHYVLRGTATATDIGAYLVNISASSIGFSGYEVLGISVKQPMYLPDSSSVPEAHHEILMKAPITAIPALFGGLLSGLCLGAFYPCCQLRTASKSATTGKEVAEELKKKIDALDRKIEPITNTDLRDLTQADLKDLNFQLTATKCAAKNAVDQVYVGKGLAKETYDNASEVSAKASDFMEKFSNLSDKLRAEHNNIVVAEECIRNEQEELERLYEAHKKLADEKSKEEILSQINTVKEKLNDAQQKLYEAHTAKNKFEQLKSYEWEKFVEDLDKIKEKLQDLSKKLSDIAIDSSQQAKNRFKEALCCFHRCFINND